MLSVPHQSLLVLSPPSPRITGALVLLSLSHSFSCAFSLSLTHSSSESTLIIAVSHMFSPLPPPRPFSPTPPVLFLWCCRQVGHRQLEDCFHRKTEIGRRRLQEQNRDADFLLLLEHGRSGFLQKPRDSNRADFVSV